MRVRSPKEESCQRWLMFSKYWSCYNKTHDPIETNTTQMNHVFANCSEEDEINPLTVKEIVEAQKADITLKHFFKCNAVLDRGLELQLVENECCIFNKGRLVIPKPLQRRATMWYHHYLSTAPQACTSRGDNEICNVLERNENKCPIHNKVMQILPSE